MAAEPLEDDLHQQSPDKGDGHRSSNEQDFTHVEGCLSLRVQDGFISQGGKRLSSDAVPNAGHSDIPGWAVNGCRHQSAVRPNVIQSVGQEASGTTTWTFEATELQVGNNLVEMRSINSEGVESNLDSRIVTRELSETFRDILEIVLGGNAGDTPPDLNEDDVIDSADLVYFTTTGNTKDSTER